MTAKKTLDDIAGEIILDPEVFIKKLSNVKALIFDWDGIFNDGVKGKVPSTFNEIDSMGINMLRFGYYLIHGQNPFTAIVTGEKNETAIQWAEREHFFSVFLKVKNKADIIDLVKKGNAINPEEILFVFDDIHDLSLAKKAGVRFLVQNSGSRLFAKFCRENNYCDYITRNTGGTNALREIAETVLYTLDLFEETIKNRIEFKGIYHEYWQKRNSVKTYISELNY